MSNINVIISRLVSEYERAQSDIASKLSGELTQWKRSFLKQRQREIYQILDNLRNSTTDWIKTEIPNIYKSGIILADSHFADKMIKMSSIHQTNVVRYAKNLSNCLNDSIDFVGRRTDDIFRKLSLESLLKSNIDGDNARIAMRKLIENIEKNGISSFNDSLGREWTLKNYAEMAIRTNSISCSRTGTIERLKEREHDLVEITSHGDCCDKCEPYDGAILSISGNSDKYDSLDDAENDGLFHPNCGHSPVPYFDDE